MPCNASPDGLDAEVSEGGDRSGHQALAAGLVDDPGPFLPHGHVEPGPRGVEGRGKTGRAAADHEEVLHGATCGAAPAGAGASCRAASAWFSTRSRTLSSTALQTVKTAAVTQAE